MYPAMTLASELEAAAPVSARSSRYPLIDSAHGSETFPPSQYSSTSLMNGFELLFWMP